MFGGKINKPVVYTEYVNMRPFLSEPQVFLPPLSACLSSVIILTTPPLRTLPHIILFHPSLSLSLTFPLPTLSSSLSSFSPLLLPPSLSLSTSQRVRQSGTSYMVYWSTLASPLTLVITTVTSETPRACGTA